MNMNSLMQDLSRIFTQIEDCVNGNQLPSSELTKELMDCSRKIYQSAPDEWGLEAEDFAHLTNQLHKAVLDSDQAAAIQLVQSLDDAQRFCHDAFC